MLEAMVQHLVLSRFENMDNCNRVLKSYANLGYSFRVDDGRDNTLLGGEREFLFNDYKVWQLKQKLLVYHDL